MIAKGRKNALNLAVLCHHLAIILALQKSSYHSSFLEKFVGASMWGDSFKFDGFVCPEDCELFFL